MRIFLNFIICYVLLPCLAIAQLVPQVEWKKSYWAPFRPDNNKAQKQSESSDEWFYDHDRSRDANGEQDGYICAGYSKWTNYFADETAYGGCLQTTAENTSISCLNFETTGNRMGTDYTNLAKIDLQGNVVWYNNYLPGNFYKGHQTADGGYIACGITTATCQLNGDTLYYQSPEASKRYFSNPAHSNPSPVPHKKALLTKTDKDGNLQWQYIYGLVPYLDKDSGQSAFNYWSTAWDVIQTEDGGYLLTGCNDYAANPADPDEVKMMKAFVIKLSSDGQFVSGTWIEPEADFHHAVGMVFTKTGTGISARYILAGEERPMNGIKKAFLCTFNASGNLIDGPWYYHSPGNIEVSDITVNKAGEILLPLVYACQDCMWASGKGEAMVYRIDSKTGAILGKISFGEVKAFDLKVGITSTDDGGFAIVSSKQPNPPALKSYSCTTNDHEVVSYTNNYYNTDTYVAKCGANDKIEWSITFDSDTESPDGDMTSWAHPDIYMRDLKRQECMYSIVPSEDGGFVVAGNNSANFDDSYMAKVKACPALSLNISSLGNFKNQTINGLISSTKFGIDNSAKVSLKSATIIPSQPTTNIISGNSFQTTSIDSTGCNIITSKPGIKSAHSINFPEELVKLYPNPTKGHFKIVSKADGKIKSMSIHDIFGNLIKNLDPNVVEIELTEYNPGVYFMRIAFENKIVNTKIILIE